MAGSLNLKFPMLLFDFQNWKIRFGELIFREVRRLRYRYTWNKVNNRVGTFTQQAGLLEGVKTFKRLRDYF